MVKAILAGLVAAPILALFGGVGLLAWQIGESWDHESTQTLIGGLVASCALGGSVLAILLAVLVGVPWGLRLLEHGGISRRAWREPEPAGWRALPAPTGQAWPQQQPALEDKAAGSWQRLPGSQIDLWDTSQPAQADEGAWAQIGSLPLSER